MYSVKERQEILNELIDMFKAREGILAIVLVGSASYGFRDNYSDIDIALVYDENCALDEVFQKTFDDINSKYNISVYLNQLGRCLQVILLDNYLEIDIGYYTIDSLSARRGEYKVVYDRTDSVNEIMRSSWNENRVKNMGTTGNVDIGNECFKIDANLWYNIIHTVNAFNRGEIYRCYFELGELRNNIISLIGKRNSLEAKRFRNIHKLSCEEKAKIDFLFDYPNSKEQLKNILLVMLELFYEEFNHWNHNPSVEKDFISKYIEENL